MSSEITAAVLAATDEVERFPTGEAVGGALAVAAVFVVAAVLLYRSVRLRLRVRDAAARGVELLPAAYRPRSDTPVAPLTRLQAKSRNHAVTGGLLLALSAVMFVQHQAMYQKLDITTPTTAAGLPRVHDAEFDRWAAQNLYMLKRHPLTEKAMTAVYGRTERPVFVAAATLSEEPSDAAARNFPEEFFIGMRRAQQLTGTTEPHPAGDRGGHMGCTFMTSENSPIGACAWIDDWTFGYVAVRGGSTAAVAELTRDIRADVER